MMDDTFSTFQNVMKVELELKEEVNEDIGQSESEAHENYRGDESSTFELPLIKKEEEEEVEDVMPPATIYLQPSFEDEDYVTQANDPLSLGDDSSEKDKVSDSGAEYVVDHEGPYKKQPARSATLFCDAGTTSSTTFDIRAESLDSSLQTEERPKSETSLESEKSSSSNLELLQHVRLPKKYRVHKCSYCDYTTGRHSSLTRHLLTHTGEKPYKCEYCERKFGLKGNWKNHIRIHVGEKPFQCPECNFKTSDPSHLVAHRRIHTGEKPYQCPECDYKARLLGHLTCHQRLRSHGYTNSYIVIQGESLDSSSQTEERPKSEASIQSEKTLSSNLELQKDMRLPKKYRVHKCSYCDYTTGRHSSLTCHLLTHTGEQPYKCAYCERKFNLKGSLTRHIRIHLGEKPFQCPECDYKASDPSHLITHRRIHTGEKPYQCPECDYKARLSAHLTSHRRVHSRGKPN